MEFRWHTVEMVGLYNIWDLSWGDLTSGGWNVWRHLHSHAWRLRPAVSWNTYTWPLHVVSAWANRASS